MRLAILVAAMVGVFIVACNDTDAVTDTDDSADATGTWHALMKMSTPRSPDSDEVQMWSVYVPMEIRNDMTFVLAYYFFELEPPHHGGGAAAQGGTWNRDGDVLTLSTTAYMPVDVWVDTSRFPDFTLELRADGQLQMVAPDAIDFPEPFTPEIEVVGTWVFSREPDPELVDIFGDELEQMGQFPDE